MTMKGNTTAEVINSIESCVRKKGLIETSKAVNVALAFIGHETPRYKLVLDAWQYVIRSQR